MIWRGGYFYILPVYSTLDIMSSSFKNGFTLVELMIVIGIIGILAAALFPSLTSYLARWRDTAKISEIKQLNTALISYQIDKSTFKIPGVGGNDTGIGWINFVGTYISTIYTKSIFTGLQELGYITQWIKQKTVTDYTSPSVPTVATPTNPCINTVASVPLISWDLYILYFDDTTGQYSISGYLENPKWSDIANTQVAYSLNPANNICTIYGRNYAVGKN